MSTEYVNQLSLAHHTGRIFFFIVDIQGHLIELIPITQRTKQYDQMCRCLAILQHKTFYKNRE